MREELLKRRSGFTLIELLIVVVIIGILAAIAIPKFSSTREKAFVSAMKSDLRNLQTAQEIYYSDGNYEYASGTADAAQTLQPLEFVASEGVTVTATAETGPPRWFATATHTGTSQVCDVFVGYAAPPGGVSQSQQQGVVTCGLP